MPTLQEQFGQIDIYLFDQLLRGNITPGMRVLDAGCGAGRNLVYLLREGYEIFASDQDPAAIAQVRTLAPDPPRQTTSASNPSRPSPSPTTPSTSSSAAPSSTSPATTLTSTPCCESLWRVLKPGGLLFCRLASTIGMPHQHLTGRRYLAPDGIERFCVDEAFLMHLTAKLDAQLVDPIKTTVVQNQRCMTTWVVRKPTRNPKLLHWPIRASF